MRIYIHTSTDIELQYKRKNAGFPSAPESWEAEEEPDRSQKRTPAGALALRGLARPSWACRLLGL